MMRRIQVGVLGGALCALALSLLAAGCGKPNEDENAAWKKEKKERSKDGDKGKRPGGGGKLEAVKAKAYDGVLKGKVVGEGDRSELAKLDAAHLASLTGKQDADHCKKGNEHQYEYVVGENGNVGNVFVWIESAQPKTYIQVPEDQVKAHAGEVVVGQPNCHFTPHCLVLFPKYRADGKLKETGQKFFVTNDDTVTHNTKMQGGVLNPVKDQTLAKGAKLPYPLNPERGPVTVSCGIHPYMRGYVRVFEHPWAAVTKASKDPKDAAFGTFEIKGLPVGVPLKLFAWHEKGEYINEGGSAGKEITLKSGENAENFTMKYPK
jgi:hypothetical protein